MNPGYANDQFGNDLNNWFRAGFYQTIGGRTTNVPPGCDGWGLITIFNAMATSNAWTVQIFQPSNSVGSLGVPLFYRYWNTSWSKWEPIATATPPQEFNLPLVDGISGTAKYSKDQFGIVRVYVAVLKNSGTITNNEILGTLPEGFCPKYNFAVVGFGNCNQNNIADRHPINMIISSNGNITASFLSETDGTKIASLYGTAEFLPKS